MFCGGDEFARLAIANHWGSCYSPERPNRCREMCFSLLEEMFHFGRSPVHACAREPLNIELTCEQLKT